MGDWIEVEVDLKDSGPSTVEARETPTGNVEWRGLPNTTFATWAGGEQRRPDSSLAEQVQDAALYWFENTKMSQP